MLHHVTKLSVLLVSSDLPEVAGGAHLLKAQLRPLQLQGMLMVHGDRRGALAWRPDPQVVRAGDAVRRDTGVTKAGIEPVQT